MDSKELERTKVMEYAQKNLILNEDNTFESSELIADWHLKEVEKARAEGMKKAAEDIRTKCNSKCIVFNGGAFINALDAVEMCSEIITEANKTLEAGGEK